MNGSNFGVEKGQVVIAFFSCECGGDTVNRFGEVSKCGKESAGV